MENNEVSLHEVRVYLALQSHPDRWLTNHAIKALLGDVGDRTIRHHTLRLVQAGLLDQAEVFPGHRYRWSAKGAKRNTAYALRLQQAAEVFGLECSPAS